MAEIIWSKPALNDLDAIADYIALDNPEAAKRLVRKVYQRIGQLEDFPRSGSKPQELEGWQYRQIIEPPCRIFYRHDDARVYIVHVLRTEQLLRPGVLWARDPNSVS